MSVEVLNESGTEVDVAELTRLSRFVFTRMRLHPATEMTLRLVDEGTIEALNGKWMEKPAPTDVLAFPMDELEPGHEGEESPQGYLGDIALCPQVASRQAAEAGHSELDEIRLLTTHGILHLLGYDHAEDAEHQVMFTLQARLLAEWTGVRSGDELAEPDEHSMSTQATGEQPMSNRISNG